HFDLPIEIAASTARLRTSMALIIGTATTSALIGAGGLAHLNLLGIDRNNASLIIIGAIPAALLAIIFDVVLRIIQHLSYRKIIITLGSILLVMLLITLGPLFGQKNESITIAGKLGTEPSIITKMYKILIEEETDYSVRV